MIRDNSRLEAICNLKQKQTFVKFTIFVIDDLKQKYDELLEQFNDLKVAYDEQSDELEKMRAALANNVRLFLF